MVSVPAGGQNNIPIQVRIHDNDDFYVIAKESVETSHTCLFDSVAEPNLFSAPAPPLSIISAPFPTPATVT